MIYYKLKSLIKKFTAECSGNIAMTFGLTLIPIMVSIGSAVDYSRFSSLQTKVASATDAAMLAATSAVMTSVDVNDYNAVMAKLNAEFEPFFLANLADAVGYEYNGTTLSYDVGTKIASADVDIDYQTVIMGIAGVEELEVDNKTSTSLQMKAGGAVSMYLALDVSGSMAWSNGEGGSKMNALKDSVGVMLTTLQAADPDQNYIRMGVDGYESYVYYRRNLRWNLANINSYVQTFYPYGGTNSSPAMSRAYSQLIKSKEITEHANKSGQTPDLVIVFMTDGSNNYSSYDTVTLNTCTAAKQYGMKIYTVAYKAPSNGQALLASCATSPEHYFRAENVAELAAAFGYIGATVAQSLVLSQ